VEAVVCRIISTGTMGQLMSTCTIVLNHELVWMNQA